MGDSNLINNNGPIITGLSYGNISIGIFTFNTRTFVGFNLKDDEILDNPSSQVLLSKSFYADSTTFGETRTYIANSYLAINRTFPIVTSKYSNGNNLEVVNKEDFIQIFETNPNIILNPTELLAELIKITPIEVDDFICITMSKDIAVNSIIERCTINPKVSASFFQTEFTTLNIGQLMSNLYAPFGIRFIQQKLPYNTLNMSFDEFNTSFGENTNTAIKYYEDFGVSSGSGALDVQQDVKTCFSNSFSMYTPEDYINAPVANSQGVISFRDAIDYTKVKELSIHEIADDGSVSARNPINGSEVYERWSQKGTTENILNRTFNHSAAIGSDYAYAISAPLFMFFNSTKIKSEINDDSNNTNTSGSGSANALNVFGNLSMYTDLKLQKDNTEPKKNFIGRLNLTGLIMKAAKLYNNMYANQIPISVVGEIPVFTKLSFNVDLNLKKFDKDSLSFRDTDGGIEIDSPNLLVVSSNVRHVATTDGIVPISDVMCVDIENTLKMVQKTPTKYTDTNNSGSGSASASADGYIENIIKMLMSGSSSSGSANSDLNTLSFDGDESFFNNFSLDDELYSSSGDGDVGPVGGFDDIMAGDSFA